MQDELKKLFYAAGFLDEAGLHVINRYSPAILFAVAEGNELKAEVLIEATFQKMRQIASTVTWIDEDAKKLFA